MANFDGTKSTDINKNNEEGSGLNAYVNSLFDASVTWEDIQWLKSISTLPIVLKGILTAQDAIMGVEVGAAGIWVSNHGARQIDGTPASVSIAVQLINNYTYFNNLDSPFFLTVIRLRHYLRL